MTSLFDHLHQCPIQTGELQLDEKSLPRSDFGRVFLTICVTTWLGGCASTGEVTQPVKPPAQDVRTSCPSLVRVLQSCSSMHAHALRPASFFSYHSEEPGCGANPATDLELAVDGERERWTVIAPRRVVSTDSERKRAGGPLDIEIAEPLQSTLRQRLADSPSEGRSMIGKSNVTRIKIVTVSHDVARLGMGEALANIRMDFYVCVNGDLPESSVVKTVMRSGPKLSTLWHQPRGEELQTAFRMARDNDLKAIVAYALRSAE